MQVVLGLQTWPSVHAEDVPVVPGLAVLQSAGPPPPHLLQSVQVTQPPSKTAIPRIIKEGNLRRIPAGIELIVI